MILTTKRYAGYRKVLSAVLLLLVVTIAQAQESMLTVITNTQGAPEEMRFDELKSVLRGEKQRWSDGTKVHIALMKTTTPIGQATCKKVYNMSADRVKRFWLELSFAGNADAPTFCNTAAELESFVSQNPGAIGILDDFSGAEGTKATSIDGKKSF